MNPLRRLEADHRTVESLFDRIQTAPAGAPRRVAYASLKDTLERHADLASRAK